MSKLFEALQRSGEKLDVVVDSTRSAIEPAVLESLESASRDAALHLPAALEYTAAPVSPCDDSVIARMDFERITRATCSIRHDSRIAIHGGVQPAVIERIRVLDHRLRQLRQSRPLTRVLVTSPGPREGKTMVATSLAIMLARTSTRVLLIDADLRRPSTEAVFGLDSHPGVTDVVAGDVSLEAALRFLGAPATIYHLAAGERRADAAELLKSDATRKLFDQVAVNFEWVVVDSSPILPFSDALCLATVTDGTLFIVRSGVTRRKDLREALSAFEKENVVGLVLNGSSEIRDDRYSSYYQSKIR